MSNVLFIADLHLGHKWMAYHRGFQDEFYHDEHIIDQWNKKVHKRDIVYILGDITMNTNKHYYQLDKLNGRKIVVLGNHDNPRDVPELLKYVEKVGGAVDYKGCFLTHIPIHESEIHRVRFNIHGHIHENVIEHDKYINVSAEVLDYIPKTLEELYEIREDKINKRSIKDQI